MARPLAPIDEELVKKLARIQCTMREIAAVCEVDVGTISRRFSTLIKEEAEHGRMSLRRKQMEVAMSGQVTMLIWLGKQYLGQSEKNEVRQKSEVVVQNQAQIKEKAAELIRISEDKSDVA